MVALEHDEYIVKEFRRHWFVIVIQAVVFALLAIIPAVFYPILIVLAAKINLSVITASLIFFAVYPLWLLVIWSLFFIFWTTYYLDVLIVTNRRVIDVNQKTLFNREITTLRLENIQDISTDVRGIIPTFLNFGEVKVQTAGEHNQCVIQTARNPDQVKEVITDEHDRVMEALKNQNFRV